MHIPSRVFKFQIHSPPPPQPAQCKLFVGNQTRPPNQRPSRISAVNRFTNEAEYWPKNKFKLLVVLPSRIRCNDKLKRKSSKERFYIGGPLNHSTAQYVHKGVVSSENEGEFKYNVNCWVLVWNRKAGHYFFVIFSLHVVLNTFLLPVPVRTA